MDALFEADGGLLIPTELARGPWSAAALHGGPVAAAVARATEQHLRGTGEPGPTWQVARMTIDLIRPVPVEPLVLHTATTRPGRKVTIVETTVATRDDRELVRARVLAISQRPGDAPSPAEATLVPPPVGLPDEYETSEQPPGAGEWPAFHNSGVEMRWAAGVWREPGPATVWMRLRVPVVAGEQPTPVMRAAAVADFGNGISSELSFASWSFINPDLTLHLARTPVGEWICLGATTVMGDRGIGLAESGLFDTGSRFGRAVQSLLVERGR